MCFFFFNLLLFFASLEASPFHPRAIASTHTHRTKRGGGDWDVGEGKGAKNKKLAECPRGCGGCSCDVKGSSVHGRWSGMALDKAAAGTISQCLVSNCDAKLSFTSTSHPFKCVLFFLFFVFKDKERLVGY